MRISSKFMLVAVMLVGAQVMLLGKAHAIAAFSRQHKAECTACHTIYPELNDFGEAFYKNGFVWPGKTPAEKNRAASQQTDGGEKSSTGGELQRINEGLLLSAVPEVLPISFSASQSITINDHAADHTDLSTRFLGMQAAGNFREVVGFWVNYTLYSAGTYVPTTSTVQPNKTTNSIGELYAVLRHVQGTPVNIKIGRMSPQLGLWKAGNKVTSSSFAPYTYKVGPSTTKSPFTVSSTEDGLELNAILGNRVFVAGGIVDRDGQNKKEGYGHASVRIGGTDFLGHEPVVDLEKDSIWDFLALTVGTYGYYGSNAPLDSNNSAIQNKDNNFYRIGLDTEILYKSLRVRLSGVRGSDSNPNFDLSAAAKDTKSLVGAAEAEYRLASNLIGALRYEYQDDGALTTRRYIAGVAYALLQNTKLSAEYKQEKLPTVNNRTVQLGLGFCF